MSDFKAVKYLSVCRSNVIAERALTAQEAAPAQADEATIASFEEARAAKLAKLDACTAALETQITALGGLVA